MSEIIKGKLYLGDINCANNIEFLETNKIEAIITVANCCDVSKSIQESKRVFKYNIVDNFDEDIIKYFSELTDLIENENCVLVHCVAGISRSATIVIAYLMTIYEMTLLDAFNFVKTKRSVIHPNHSFIKQLIAYEFTLYGKNSVSPKGREYKKDLLCS